LEISYIRVLFDLGMVIEDKAIEQRVGVEGQREQQQAAKKMAGSRISRNTEGQLHEDRTSLLPYGIERRKANPCGGSACFRN
jgi:hypothetical protein